MKPDNKPIAYDTFQADVKQRKSKVWVKMLADEPVERSFGRRPRAPLKEELLLRLDKARLARERLLAAKRTDES